MVEQPLAEGHNAFVYVFEGQAEIGADHQAIADGELALLGPGDGVRLAVPAGARAARGCCSSPVSRCASRSRATGPS